MNPGDRAYWYLICKFGCTLWVESETLTPPVPLLDLRCRYHEQPEPMIPFLPLDVRP